VSFLPAAVGVRLLRALQPVLRLSPQFQDALLLLLRKALFHRHVLSLCLCFISHSFSLTLSHTSPLTARTMPASPPPLAYCCCSGTPPGVAPRSLSSLSLRLTVQPATPTPWRGPQRHGAMRWWLRSGAVWVSRLRCASWCMGAWPSLWRRRRRRARMDWRFAVVRCLSLSVCLCLSLAVC
jgi:hypothetical protein